jgi:hypothetical protein
MKRQSNTAFQALVSHFMRRLAASEEEQGSGGIGFGLGAVLAILASPGAFASIFLMAKYSTLIQWLNGQHIDAIRRSPSDEYFFVILSMTITGLVMVARWNRLFPDRRDFFNLAILPIPIRNVFLANLEALIVLGLLFGIDVNVVSSVLFPFFVTLSIGSVEAFLRVGFAHVTTVLLASLFSFFATFGLVGLLMLVVPRRIFRSVSVAMRILLAVVLLTEFFSNILVQLFEGKLPAGYMNWLPPYWFLGIYESIVGIASPHMATLAKQAVLALTAAVFVSLAAYALCYRRLFLRLPETFDAIAGSRPLFQLRVPEPLLAPLFRSQFERACVSFAVKVLSRSEQHLMFLGAYLGVGLVVVAQNALDITGSTTRSVPGAAYLATPLLVAFLVSSGMRYVFDRPAALDANWAFQFALGEFPPHPRTVAKKLILWVTIPWEVLILLPLSIARMGLLLGLLHTSVVIVFTVLFSNFLLVNFRKIPFTCSAQLNIQQLLVQMIGTIFVVWAFVPAAAAIERWALLMPARIAVLAAALTCVWYSLARYRREADRHEASLKFENGPGAAFELLKLTAT